MNDEVLVRWYCFGCMTNGEICLHPDNSISIAMQKVGCAHKELNKSCDRKPFFEITESES